MWQGTVLLHAGCPGKPRITNYGELALFWQYLVLCRTYTKYLVV
jgi:hypothetical protein